MADAYRFPAIYIPHGGGPWPFMPMDPARRAMLAPMADYLATLVSGLPQRPRAVLVVSAHWEAPVPTVMTAPQPPMYYDYGGFPPETYRLQWPAPSAPDVAARVHALLQAAGLPTADDPQRGYDHGTFVPLMLALPKADVPICQLSLVRGLDPRLHLAIGRALAPLRDEGVLLVGSGNSYHNMRGFGQPTSTEPSRRFDDWMVQAASLPPAEREAALAAWADAPAARLCHPREEHLIPLQVMAGAGGQDAASIPLRMVADRVHVSAVQFG